MQDVEFYSIDNWGQLILVESSIANDNPTVVLRNALGFEIGRGSSNILLQADYDGDLTEIVPVDPSAIYLTSKTFLISTYTGMGVGKILYDALARACRRIQPSAVLCPSDLVERNNPNYRAGAHSTSAAAHSFWQRNGRDWL